MLSYMGSKRRLAKQIMDKMLELKPNAKYFVDLFGGGGWLSREALKRGLNVKYNDINTGIVEFLKWIKKSDIKEIESLKIKWVTREEFHKHKNDTDWYGGYISLIWSFGNNLDSYLYGKHIEEIKYKLHKLVYEDRKISLVVLKSLMKVKFVLDDIDKDILDVVNSLKEKSMDVRLQHIDGFNNILNNLDYIKSNNIEYLNYDYKDVIIDTPKDETIIYIDPPYKNTGGYKDYSIEHEELWDWVRNSKYDIFVSEYEAPFSCIFEIEHIKTLSATNNNLKTIEKLFYNIRG